MVRAPIFRYIEMTIKKIIGNVHLVLGLSSGIIVFIIAITGCIYSFQEEIQDMTQPYRYALESKHAVLPPSRLVSIAGNALPGKHIHAVNYPGNGRSAQVIFFSFAPEYYYYLVYINPYSGEVLQVEDMTQNFFRIILDGHFYLWLPPNVGQPIAASATLVFFFLMITGLILWWPKNKATAKQRFTIKWNARWRRKNYDLHRVLGFYALSLGIILSITGLVWGFQWFAQGYYKLAGGEKSLVYADPPSNKKEPATLKVPAIDAIFEKMIQLYPEVQAIEVHLPENDTASIAANANLNPGTYYKTDYRYFDQYTLEELSVDHIYGRYNSATNADKLMRMNYDIHVGAIAGLPGKILMFFVSLVCASLPITGTLLWWGRRQKEKRDRNGSAGVDATTNGQRCYVKKKLPVSILQKD
jgi:uncharacterized iron-regulated membrane protein